MSISNIGNQLSQQYLLQMLQSSLNDTSRQNSTGKISGDISGLGNNGVTNAISDRNQIKLVDAYTANLNAANTRFSITDTSLTSITDAARNLLTTLQSQLQTQTPAASIISASAKSQLDTVVSRLNIQADGRYVFSGQNFDSPAVDNEAGLLSNMGTIVTAALSNPATTAASAITSAQTVSGTNLGVSTAAINGGTVSIKADDNVSVSTSLKANNSGFSDIMRAMAMVANLPQPTTATQQTNYWNIVNGAITLLQNGATAIDSEQGTLGTTSKQVSDLLTQHSDTQTNLQQYISNNEDTDAATVATKFSALQTQLQASYSIIASMKDMSLVKYL